MAVSSLAPGSAAPAEDHVVGRPESLLATNPVRVAILCDIVEENWPSMDLVGDMLFKHLQQDHSDSVSATRLSPNMRRRFTRSQTASGRLFNADRFLNRFRDYPRVVRRRKAEFDLFHVVDHSYGQLLHELPPGRTIVTCHDLDTFKCLLHPAEERRSVFFRKMMKRTLAGFREAARVVCDSEAIRDELLFYDLVTPERVSVIPLGVHPACTAEPDPAADAEAKRLLQEGPADVINLLHVGSTIRRKRIDVLLEVLAEVRREFPQARLVRVGGPFTADQIRFVKILKLENAITVLPYLSREVLAAIYRQAALVLQPSDAEGFGLPVIEAMACGTPVIASDLPVLHEVGGDAASYVPVADVPAWTKSVCGLLRERYGQPEDWVLRRVAGMTQASRFSWAKHAQKIVELYREIMN